jgi:hypothetical protein
MAGKFSIIGKTFTAIDGMEPESWKVTFTLATGERLAMDTLQDCGESVELVEVIGDVEDLLNSPIVSYEEVEDPDEDPDFDYSGKSHTWTIYKFETMKGFVTLRWLSESNGYYSEGVDFYFAGLDEDGFETVFKFVSGVVTEENSGVTK